MEVEITIHGAEKLRKMDLFGSDPYVIIQLQNEQIFLHKTKNQKSMSPTFDETFTTTIKRPINNNLDILCMHRQSIGQDKIIGRAVYPLNCVTTEEPLKYDLELRHSQYNGPCGIISVSVKSLNMSYKTLEERLNKEKKIQHYVVLMQENRSFDHIFGYLYKKDEIPEGKTFEGVEGKNLSNPIPEYAQTKNGPKEVPVTKGYNMEGPTVCPGEELPHVMQQIYGSVNPKENRFRSVHDMKEPHNIPDNKKQEPTMDGFLENYIDNFSNSNREKHQRIPTYEEFSQIMECYPPEALPVLSTLAKEFGVCDHWFSAVPSQTFTNRAFFHSATSGGEVVNAPFNWWINDFKAKTVFEQLEEAGLDWKVYYDTDNILSATLIIHYQNLKKYEDHFKSMKEFYHDVESGSLPHYSFIEPRLFLDHNDMHPPYKFKFGKVSPSLMLAGEKLISDIYMAIRGSNAKKGSNYKNTCFMITFDEHGGTYDHVPPPKATPPDQFGPGQFGFDFYRFGVRVPTIIVSAYTKPNTIINDVLSHTSMMRTIRKNWDIDQPLTLRDEYVQPIPDEAFDLEKPRMAPKNPQDKMDWPITFPRFYNPVQDKYDIPLNDLQISVLLAVAEITGEKLIIFDELSNAVCTTGQALKFLERAAKKLNINYV
eukprot:gene514-8027_t